jgi:hypothetical protein
MFQDHPDNIVTLPSRCTRGVGHKVGITHDKSGIMANPEPNEKSLVSALIVRQGAEIRVCFANGTGQFARLYEQVAPVAKPFGILSVESVRGDKFYGAIQCFDKRGRPRAMPGCLDRLPNAFVHMLEESGGFRVSLVTLLPPSPTHAHQFRFGILKTRSKRRAVNVFGPTLTLPRAIKLLTRALPLASSYRFEGAILMGQ